MNSRPSNNTSN